MINYNPTHVGRKRDGELWSTNKKVTGANVDPPKLNFSADCISALRGCWPLKFLHAIEIDHGLLAHTPNGMEVAPKKFKGEHVKLGLKFSVLAPITLWLLGVTSQNFTTWCAARQGCSSGHYFWEGPPPKIWEGKKRLKFGATSGNYRLRSRISPERTHISKIGKVHDQLQPLPRWAKKDGEL